MFGRKTLFLLAWLLWLYFLLSFSVLSYVFIDEMTFRKIGLIENPLIMPLHLFLMALTSLFGLWLNKRAELYCLRPLNFKVGSFYLLAKLICWLCASFFIASGCTLILILGPKGSIVLSLFGLIFLIFYRPKNLKWSDPSIRSKVLR